MQIRDCWILMTFCSVTGVFGDNQAFDFFVEFINFLCLLFNTDQPSFLKRLKRWVPQPTLLVTVADMSNLN